MMHSIIKQFLIMSFVGALSSIVLSPSGMCAAVADVKVAVVDLQKALQSIDSGKKARSTLEKEFNEKKKHLQAEEESLKKATEEFKKQSMVLSEEARSRKQAEIQERILKYRELFGKSQMEIQNRERELTEPLINKLRSIVQEIGESESYTLIFEKNENSVLYHMKKDDLTDKVVAQFNKKNNG